MLDDWFNLHLFFSSLPKDMHIDFFKRERKKSTKHPLREKEASISLLHPLPRVKTGVEPTGPARALTGDQTRNPLVYW